MANQTLGGYNGKILRVNLSNNSVSVEAIDELVCRKYLGGAGFVSYFLLKEMQQGVDPLGSDNKLIFALGPLTGLLLPGSGRSCVGAKSPLTGTIAKSEAGGFWSAELKRAGYDVIIIEGKAEKPVYLWVHDGETSIRDASRLWGKNTKEAQEAIKTELGDNRVRVALIGPAGEKLVRYACIMDGLHDCAGRGGLGAVMGSKNLKAIAVRGHQLPPVSKPEGVRELRRWLLANMELVSGNRDVGTGARAFMGMAESIGHLPVRNFRDGLFPKVNTIDADAVKETIRTGMEGCFACPVCCKKVVQFQEPYPVDPVYGGPEYETLAALGSNCGIDNLKAIAKGNELCNAYSLDTISMGGVIAFAMECFENGLLSVEDTNGIELRFGNDEAMLKIIELVAKREGIGDLLAEGTVRAAQRIGKGAQELTMQVKGLELGMHEPRLNPGLGLGYMVNPHGADHMLNMLDLFVQRSAQEVRPLGIIELPSPDDIGPPKVALFRLLHFKRLIFDCLVLCCFVPYTFEQIADVTAAVTGWDTGVMEQLRVAERVLTTARLFNIREGFTAADDKLPKRFFQPKTDGALADKSFDSTKLEKAKSYYYTLMGWDAKTGIPTPERLEELGIP